LFASLLFDRGWLTPENADQPNNRLPPWRFAERFVYLGYSVYLPWKSPRRGLSIASKEMKTSIRSPAKTTTTQAPAKSSSPSTRVAPVGYLAQLAAVADRSSQVSQSRALQELANRSPQVRRLRALQEMANGSPRVQAQLKLRDEINNSPRVQELRVAAIMNHAQPPVTQPRIKEEEIPAQRETTSNRTGLPDRLKSGVESLSGISLDDVKVHYNSDKPAQLNAMAYAQGTDIHVAPGQEKHLPHEAWHIVQQAQGRVQPTMQMKNGVPVNDDQALEQEANVMGGKSLQFGQPKSVMTTIDPTAAGKLQEGDERSGNGTIIQPIWVKKGNEGNVEWVDTTDLSGYTETAESHGPTEDHDGGPIYVIKESGETTTTTTSAMLPTTPPSSTATTSPPTSVPRKLVGFQKVDSLEKLLPLGAKPPRFASAALEFTMNGASVQGNMRIYDFDPYEIDVQYVDKIDTEKSSKVRSFLLKRIPTATRIFEELKYKDSGKYGYLYYPEEEVIIDNVDYKYHITVPWVDIDPAEAIEKKEEAVYWTNLLLKFPTSKDDKSERRVHISAEFPDKKNFHVWVDANGESVRDSRSQPDSPLKGNAADALAGRLKKIINGEKRKMQMGLIKVLKNVFKFDLTT
jgi:hypothetical protein